MSLASFIANVNPRWKRRLPHSMSFAFLIVLSVWALIEITVARAYAWVTVRDLIGVSAVFALLIITAGRLLLEIAPLHRESQSS